MGIILVQFHAAISTGGSVVLRGSVKTTAMCQYPMLITDWTRSIAVHIVQLMSIEHIVHM